jgi:hypothetical protein
MIQAQHMAFNTGFARQKGGGGEQLRGNATCMADICNVSLFDSCVRRPSRSCCSSPGVCVSQRSGADAALERTVALLQPPRSCHKLI